MQNSAVDRLPIVQLVGYEMAPAEGDTRTQAPVPSHSTAVDPNAWKAERSKLLHYDYPVLGPDGEPTGAIGSYTPLEVALETWDAWAQGETGPAVGDGRPGGSPALETGQFLTAYDTFVAPRPAIKSLVLAYLRADPDLEAAIGKDPKFKPFYDGDSEPTNELTRDFIGAATAAGFLLPLAVCIYPPILEAACAAFFTPSDFGQANLVETKDLEAEYGRDYRQRLEKLTNLAKLNVLQHAYAAFPYGPKDEMLREASLTGQAVRAAAEQLVYTGDVPILGQRAIEQTEHTATLQCLLNLVAPRQEGAATTAAQPFLAQARQEMVPRIQRAIAMTIFESLPHLSGTSDEHMATAPAYRDDAASSSGKSVSFNLEDEVKVYNPQEAPSQVRTPVAIACAPAHSALRKKPDA